MDSLSTLSSIKIQIAFPLFPVTSNNRPPKWAPRFVLSENDSSLLLALILWSLSHYSREDTPTPQEAGPLSPSKTWGFPDTSLKTAQACEGRAVGGGARHPGSLPVSVCNSMKWNLENISKTEACGWYYALSPSKNKTEKRSL